MPNPVSTAPRIRSSTASFQLAVLQAARDESGGARIVVESRGGVRCPLHVGPAVAAKFGPHVGRIVRVDLVVLLDEHDVFGAEIVDVEPLLAESVQPAWSQRLLWRVGYGLGTVLAVPLLLLSFVLRIVNLLIPHDHHRENPFDADQR